MEEKKLTDEEIVEALECCVKNRENRRFDCDLKICEDDNFLIKILDLIHRLQDENERLKKPRKYILANKVYTDSTLKGWTKEDLIEQIRILEHNWACAEESLNNSAKNSDKIFAEQKAEIERIDLENYELYKQIADLKIERAELQKQVYELKQRYLDESKERCKFEQLYGKKCHEHNIGLGVQRNAWEKKVKQAVKDTAKEICDLILEHWEKKQFVECDWLRVAIAEKYGVEVE